MHRRAVLYVDIVMLTLSYLQKITNVSDCWAFGGGCRLMKFSKPVQILIIISHALVGWMFCGALIGVGSQFMSIQATLIVHAIGAPVKFAFTSPFQTALIFLCYAVSMVNDHVISCFRYEQVRRINI